MDRPQPPDHLARRLLALAVVVGLLLALALAQVRDPPNRVTRPFGLRSDTAVVDRR